MRLRARPGWPSSLTSVAQLGQKSGVRNRRATMYPRPYAELCVCINVGILASSPLRRRFVFVVEVKIILLVGHSLNKIGRRSSSYLVFIYI